MNVLIEAPRNNKDLANFLAKMNAKSSQHIGYCGESKEEIYDTLISDFSDLELAKSFMVAYQGEEIIGAIGLDIDVEDRSAEVWGPFVSEEYIHSNLGKELWEKVTSLSASLVDQYNFFFNVDNKFVNEFAKTQGGQLHGHHSVLVAKKSEWNKVVSEGIIEFNSEYEKGFAELHEQEFPSTYYSAQTILDRLSEENHLFISTSENELTGYVYIEAEPQHGDGSIEYIAVSNQHRKQGIGKKLLTFAVHELFAYEEIKEITLAVNKLDKSAIKLYESVGFHVKHELIHFQIDNKAVLFIQSEEDVIRMVSEDEWMMSILRSAQSLNLPDWWVCAGFVRSKIWDELHEFNDRTPLPDIDVIYFDPSNVDEETEKRYEKMLKRQQPTIPWSVKNQARMNTVNNDFPYSSSTEAIAKFPETATALGVSLDEEGKLVLTAPHGIDDVVNFNVRPTPYFSETEERMEYYHQRVHKKNWKSVWNKVEIYK